MNNVKDLTIIRIINFHWIKYISESYLNILTLNFFVKILCEASLEFSAINTKLTLGVTIVCWKHWQLCINCKKLGYLTSLDTLSKV